MNGRWLLTASAVLAWLFAVMLLFNTKAFEAPVGIDVTDKVATIAQAQGAILLGVGVINWMCRNITEAKALRAVFAGNLVIQIASLGVAGRAMILGIFPIQAAPAIVIHTVMAGAFAYYLMKTGKPA